MKHIPELRLQELAMVPETSWSPEDRKLVAESCDYQESIAAYRLIFQELEGQADPVFSPDFEQNIISALPSGQSSVESQSSGVRGISLEGEHSVESRNSGVRELALRRERRPRKWLRESLEVWGGITAAVVASVTFLIVMARSGGATADSPQPMKKGLESLSDQFSNAFSFVEGNELWLGTGVAIIVGVFLADRLFLQRGRRRSTPKA